MVPTPVLVVPTIAVLVLLVVTVLVALYVESTASPPPEREVLDRETYREQFSQ